jgi:hypothetical protein
MRDAQTRRKRTAWKGNNVETKYSPPTLPKLVANKLCAVLSIHPHPASLVHPSVPPSAHHLFRLVPLVLLRCDCCELVLLACECADMCVCEECPADEGESLWLGACPFPARENERRAQESRGGGREASDGRSRMNLKPARYVHHICAWRAAGHGPGSGGAAGLEVEEECWWYLPDVEW